MRVYLLKMKSVQVKVKIGQGEFILVKDERQMILVDILVARRVFAS